VRILAGEGRSIKEMRDRVHQLKEVTEERNLTILSWARRVHAEMWPEVQSRSDNLNGLTEAADFLERVLDGGQFFEELAQIREKADCIEAEYRAHYEDLHVRRGDAYQEVIEEISGLDGWQQLSPDIRSREIGPLLRRADTDLDLPAGTVVCRTCSATLNQMESDLAAAPAIQAQVVERIHALVSPHERIERVRLRDYLSGDLSTPEAIDDALAKLRERLVVLLEAGVKIVLE
jgi:hypothetical protein